MRLAVELRLAVGCIVAASLIAALWQAPPSLPMLALGAIHGAVAFMRPAWIPALLAVDLGLVAWESAGLAPDFFGLGHDTWVHLAISRRIAESGPLAPHPFYREHISAPLNSVVHQLYAVAAVVGKQPIADLWRWGSPIAVAALGGAVYFAHRELLRHRAAALLAALFFLTWTQYSWGYATYPRNVGPTLYFFAIGLLCIALRKNSGRFALCSGIALGAGFASHPISGVIGAMVFAPMLALDARRRSGEGKTRGAFRISALVVGGAVAVAAPWLVADALAWQARSGMVPPPTPPADVLDFAGKRLSARVPHAGWAFVALGGLVAGLLGSFTRERDPLLPGYLAAAGFAGAFAVVPPFDDLVGRTIGAEYATRFLYTFPLPALAAMGFTSIIEARRVATPGLLAAGSVALALCVSVLLHDIAPWQRPQKDVPRFENLAALEPLVKGRVVVAPRRFAYVLPYFTGSFVSWNGTRSHGNRWVYDPARELGAARLLAGEMETAERMDYFERFGVDFVLLTRDLEDTEQKLMRGGGFRRHETGGKFVLLETLHAPATHPAETRHP